AGFPSAEDVLRQSIQARGGREAALNIQSFQAKGVVLFYTESVPYGPLITNAWPMEIRALRPDKFRFSVDFNATPDASFVYLPPRYFANGFDGRTAWEALPGRRPQALAGIFLEERSEQAEFFAWCAGPENYQSLTNLGEISFEGQCCYELKLVKKSGNIETHYYNATNFLMAGIIRSSVFGPSLERYVFNDYRQFGGFQFPTRITYQAQDERDTAQLHSDELITSIEVNRMKSSDFDMPRETIPPPGPKQPQPRAVSDAEIKTMLRDWIDVDKIADAIVVGRLDDRGRRVISRGHVDGTNVNGDTVFDIASITKVFTKLLLLDMVQRGEMKLDDPVQKYLPASVHMPTRNGKEITLLNLATHTSGLSRDWDGGCTPEDLYQFLSSYQLTRNPGAEYEYSNLGACLLGLAIESKAGKPYPELLMERICRPMGLNHTCVDPQALACRVRRGCFRPPMTCSNSRPSVWDSPLVHCHRSCSKNLRPMAAVTARIWCWIQCVAGRRSTWATPKTATILSCASTSTAWFSTNRSGRPVHSTSIPKSMTITWDSTCPRTIPLGQCAVKAIVYWCKNLGHQVVNYFRSRKPTS